MTDFLESLNGRINALTGDWGKYGLVAGVGLYVTGYLVLKFHLTAIGIGTDIAVLDERYWFEGARFLVYLVSLVPNVVLLALPLALILWMLYKLVPASEGVVTWIMKPARLAIFGIVFSVVVIQFVMRQCFLIGDLLLAERMPNDPAWLVGLLLDDAYMPMYFTGMVAACIVPLAILISLWHAEAPGSIGFARGLLTFLAAVQILLLPVNYGVLIVDQALPRVTALGDEPLAAGAEAWIVWEGQRGVTFLVRRSQAPQRTLLTIPREKIGRIEISGFDRILPTIFPAKRNQLQ